MAFGIDDTLLTAAAGISLTDTLVKTIQNHRRKGVGRDIELLIEVVRVDAIEAINNADLALSQLERTLNEKGVDTALTLQEAIAQTSWWKPFESSHLKRIRGAFNALSDAAYNACDDVAALLRCHDRTGAMGEAVIESAYSKHEFQRALLNADSVQESIDILRNQMKAYKNLLA